MTCQYCYNPFLEQQLAGRYPPQPDWSGGAAAGLAAAFGDPLFSQQAQWLQHASQNVAFRPQQPIDKFQRAKEYAAEVRARKGMTVQRRPHE